MTKYRIREFGNSHNRIFEVQFDTGEVWAPMPLAPWFHTLQEAKDWLMDIIGERADDINHPYP